jgi:hypothetical protein
MRGEEMMSYRKMTEGDIGSILQFLESYTPETNVLRWQDVEEHSKFTRQALNAHPRIKEAYSSAKSRLAEARINRSASTEPVALTPEFEEHIQALYKKIQLLEHQHELWKRRWYRIAFHIRNEGVQIFSIDKPVPIGSPPLSDKEVRKILEPFDQDIPPVASRKNN